ncbi:MAG: 1,4-alpha-glucan branching protein GlgB [Acidobacteria bacterium]|nr:1,4-alpha-glucan branching protein GlgB [Acidobacteriota bacterium]
MERPSLSDERIDQALESLIRGTNGDPFAVLGPHLVTVDGRTALAIRACQPHAAGLEVIRRSPLGSPVVPMTRRHPAGVFEAVLESEDSIIDYRLRVTMRNGHSIEVDDPYRYGQILSEFDIHLFGEGRLYRAFERFGAHPMRVGDADGVHFVIWAPNAERVSVVGDLNNWDGRVHGMRQLTPSGVWELFVPGLHEGERYKFEIRARAHGLLLHKADPFGFQFEVPPQSAAIVHRLDRHVWRDERWMSERAQKSSWYERPLAIYEVHLASWARAVGEGDRPLTYRELAARLIPYVRDMGYTHIELLPVMEHPFGGSWGYQVTGFFAPTARLGSADDFRALVDACHREGIGVILDWVPAHFPRDAHGLARFDGTALYEHEDPRQGEHQDWGTLLFNYGRNEVRNFLLTNALFWLDQYHIDGLRVDAVASMLYLDYSRRADQWVPNKYGGRENLDAIEFIRELNTRTHAEYPGTMTIAEESTAWPAVSRPVYVGGLGFSYKWNMGWMHDILQYVGQDPIYRKYSHRNVTFSMLYAYTENFILPFSHDEVVHGKRSLIEKIPGDRWQQSATLRALFGFMYGHPGKKLMFMGNEFGQLREWNHDRSLDWHLLAERHHAGIRLWVRDLNAVYQAERSLHEMDFTSDGFQWIDCNDNENSIVAFVRRARDASDYVIIVLNFTPVPRFGYRVGVPEPGRYRELLNSDGGVYGGSDLGNGGSVDSDPVPQHGHPQSLSLVLPPVSCLVFKINRAAAAAATS